MKNGKFMLLSLVVLLISAGLLSPLFSDSDMYKKKCSVCHSLRNPDDYTKKDWIYNVKRMAKRAGLTADDEKEIINLNRKE